MHFSGWRSISSQSHLSGCRTHFAPIWPVITVSTVKPPSKSITNNFAEPECRRLLRESLG